MYWNKLVLSGASDLAFPLFGVSNASPYILKNVDGLGPPDIDVYFSDTIDEGNIYQARRPQNREIVMRVGLNPDYAAGQTVSDLRMALYGLLTPGNYENVIFYIQNDDEILMYTEVYVKKFETVPFSKEPEVQITLASPQAYFQSDQVEVDLTTLDRVNPYINNPGSAGTGFYMRFRMLEDALGGTVLQNDIVDYIYIQKSLFTDDVVTINTNAGQRAATLLHAGVTSSLLIALTEPVTWLQLHAGINHLNMGPGVVIWEEITLTPRYWGV